MPIVSHTPLHIGLRYLLRKKLSYLAMVGVAVGVGTLIVVMSVMSGFDKQLRSVIRGYLSDLTVLPTGGELHALKNYEDACKSVLEKRHVAAVAPYIEGPGLLRIQRLDHMEHVLFRGMDPEREPKVTLFGDQFMWDGTLADLRRVYLDDNGADVRSCLIGSEMARNWSAYYQICELIKKELPSREAFDAVYKMTKIREAPTRAEARERLQEAIAEISRTNRELAQTVALNGEAVLRDEIVLVTATSDLQRRLKKYVVAGVFKTGRYDYDSGVVLLSLESAMDFVASDGGVTGLHVKLDDYAHAQEVRAALAPAFRTVTWEDQQRNFLEAVQMERFLMALILSFVGVLAGFCIFAILVMTVYEKRRDIGILKAVGFTSSDVALVFLVDGVAIGVFGAALGMAGGLLFAFHINGIAAFVERWTHWTPFPRNVYYFNEIPADHGLTVPFAIAIGAIIFSLIFSVLPALKAARTDPVDTLRFE